jgi:hypothetical protein
MEPLPPVKEVEYRCIIGKGFDEILGREYTTFSFETAKEFSSFRYEIAVRYRVEPGNIVFRVLGMTATRMMMPSFGTAKSVLKVPHLVPGVYAMTFIKSDGNENVFQIEVTRKGIQILKPIPRKRFIDIIILKETATAGAKISSTVSKTPTMPLVPRTIQKRQPVPPTPEELEILEALKSETPEERDRREEMELFGGKKRLSKKDLAVEERELKKLGDKTEKNKSKDKKNSAKKEKSKPVKKAVAKKAKVAKAKSAKPKKGKKR